MRFLFLGDIVGRSGREAVCAALPRLKRELRLDFVVANGENAAAGRGITPKILDELLAGGVDLVTGGNHSWDRREIVPAMGTGARLLRPLNLPPGTPGTGLFVLAAPRAPENAKGGLLVLNLMGRLFMDLCGDPFALADEVLRAHRLGLDHRAILVDFHAEATSEKAALAHHLDGRVTAVIGTHSHVPTSDQRILAGGTAFQSDTGMCGDYDSVIGLEIGAAVRRFTLRALSAHAGPATGAASLAGLVVESDDASGLAVRVERLALGGVLEEARPEGLTFSLPRKSERAGESDRRRA